MFCFGNDIDLVRIMPIANSYNFDTEIELYIHVLLRKVILMRAEQTKIL